MHYIIKIQRGRFTYTYGAQTKIELFNLMYEDRNELGYYLHAKETLIDTIIDGKEMYTDRLESLLGGKVVSFRIID